MKNKIVIIFFLISIISKTGISQAPIAGEYRTDNYLDKFVGTWLWSLNQDTVIIKFKKIKYQNSDPVTYFDDVLMGCHKYVKNGVVIEDNLWKFNTIGQNLRGSLYSWSNNRGSDTCSVYSTFRDSSKHKIELIDIKYLHNTVPQISWLLYPKEEFIRPPKIEGITLPSELILTKQ